MTSYDPLNDPEERPVLFRSVDDELQLARRLLDEVAAANIHDPDAMIRAASGLNYRMRALLAALDAERGEIT